MQNTRMDRFGNMTMLCKTKENKNGFQVGYVEIGNKLYKLEPSKASDGNLWIKVTALNKRSSNRSF